MNTPTDTQQHQRQHTDMEAIDFENYYGIRAFTVLARAIDAAQAKMVGRAFATLDVAPEMAVTEFGTPLSYVVGRDATSNFARIFFLAQAYAEKTYKQYLVDTTNFALPGNRLFLNLYTRPYVPRAGTPAHPHGFDNRVDMRNVPDLDEYIALLNDSFTTFDEFQNVMGVLEDDEEQMAFDPLYAAAVAEDAALYESDVDEAVDASEEGSFEREAAVNF